MTVILGIALIGMRGETVVQIVLLITLSASLLNFFIGSFLPVTAEKRRHGFEGYSCRLDRCSIDALLLNLSFSRENHQGELWTEIPERRNIPTCLRRLFPLGDGDSCWSEHFWQSKGKE